MKKIVLMMALVAGFSVMSFNAGAVQVCNEVTTNASDKFYQVDIKSLSPSIQEALYKAYPNCLVKEAYTSDSNLVIKYKFVITTESGQEERIFMNEKGEVVSY